MIRNLTKFLVTGAAALALVPAVDAGGREAGSVLVYPIHRSSLGAVGSAAGSQFFTIISVTNTNTIPAVGVSLGGSTNVQFEYVNQDEDGVCSVIDRTEFLTPADTLSVLTNCHNAAGGNEGYVVVTAHDPAQFKTAWSHNHLVGSELVISGTGGVYNLNAFASAAIADEGDTDDNGNGIIDFDGVEYEQLPDDLIIDTFFALNGSSLTLLSLGGGLNDTVNVAFDVWNDNEFALSATLAFECWIEEPLNNGISLVFDGGFLANNTPDDSGELDLNCDNIGDIETGWAVVRALNSNVPLLGAITAGPGFASIDGGHLLWESGDKSDGSFFTL
jgi:hypothetical protein